MKQKFFRGHIIKVKNKTRVEDWKDILRYWKGYGVIVGSYRDQYGCGSNLVYSVGPLHLGKVVDIWSWFDVNDLIIVPLHRKDRNKGEKLIQAYLDKNELL